MSANRQGIFISFPGLLHVRHTKVFPGKYIGKPIHNIHRKQKMLNSLQYYIPAVFTCLLLMLVFASNHIYRNLGLSVFLIFNLFESYTGYLPVKKQLNVHLNHNDNNGLKVISKPVFCFYNNSRLAFLGKNNLDQNSCFRRIYIPCHCLQQL
jgi:hypothetical protein